MREAIARLDLGALSHNLDRVRAVAPASRIVAVIKANAYGHGIERVLPALAGADAFGVACSEEALAIRAAGDRHPVLLLEGAFEPDELELAAREGFETVVHDAAQVEMLERARLDRPLGAWLKVDTGMHRLGVAPGETARLHARLRACGNVGKLRLMTHLAAAGDGGTPDNHTQLAAFDAAIEGLPGEVSIANSAATLGRPAAHRDWVRPGIMLYGVSPYAGDTAAAHGLAPVMTLTTRLIAVRPMRRGARVGYDGTFECPEDMPVGTAAIGYGDGYPRHAPSGAPVLVGGRRAAIAGRVSMDMIGIDLRNCPGAKAGDPVTLWGESLPVEEVARAAGTIGYELLCGVTARVHVRVD